MLDLEESWTRITSDGEKSTDGQSAVGSKAEYGKWKLGKRKNGWTLVTVKLTFVPLLGRTDK